MKICWDNLERVRYIKESGHFIIGQDIYVEKERCKQCGEPYLAYKYIQTDYCCKSCGKMGKKRSKEVRRKMSFTRKKLGISKGKNNPMYGKKFSKKHCDNMSKALKGKYSGRKAFWYGKTLPEEAKLKISISKSGKLMGFENPNWKGGISCEPYCDVWLDKEFKESIKERDGHQCLNPDCFGNIHRLSVHHIDYNKKNCKPENLITLCTSCNSRANKDREWHKSWYKAIIYRRSQ